VEEIENLRMRKVRDYEAQISQEPLWRLLANERFDLDEFKRFLGEDAANALAKSHPNLFAPGGKSATEANILAGSIWTDGEALIREIHERLGLGESPNSLATARAEADITTLQAAMAQTQAAVEAELYDKYLQRAQQVIWKNIAIQQGLDPAQAQKRAEKLTASAQEINQLARERVAQMPIHKLNVETFRHALDQALRERVSAMGSANPIQAALSVHKARMASAMLCEVLKAQKFVETFTKAVRERCKMKPGALPMDHTAALRALYGAFELGIVQGPLDGARCERSFSEHMQVCLDLSLDDPTYLPAIPDWIMNIDWRPNPNSETPEGRYPNPYTSYNLLTISQLTDIKNAAQCILNSAHKKMSNDEAADRQRLERFVNGAVEAMSKLSRLKLPPPKTLRASMQKTMSGIWSAIDALRWQMMRADGLVHIPGVAHVLGQLEQLFNGTVIQGENRMKARKDALIKALAPHVDHLARSMARLAKQHGKYLKDANGNLIALPESIREAYQIEGWTVERLIALALNCGSQSNMDRVVNGYPDLSMEAISELVGEDMALRIFKNQKQKFQELGLAGAPRPGAVGLLSAEDWTAIQGIWDALETQWEDTAKTHEREWGFKPQRLAIQPITKMTASGGIKLRGGYYPARYDKLISERVGRWDENEDLLSRNDSLFNSVTPRKSFTNQRADWSPELPVLFDPGVLLEHVHEVSTFIELSEAARFIDKITRHPAFEQEYKRVFGQDEYHAIRPNLRGLLRAEPQVNNSDVLVWMANKVRPYLTYYGLGLNLKVALIQHTAIYPAMGDLGFKPMLRAMAHMARHPSTLPRIWEVSPYLKSRLKSIDQDLRYAVNELSFKKKRKLKIGRYELTYDKLLDWMLAPIVGIDCAATAAVWTAAYNERLAEIWNDKNHTFYKRDVKNLFDPSDMGHSLAVEYADSMVKASNPDYDASSRSAFLRANNASRLVNSFASAITLFAQRGHYMKQARKQGLVSLPQYSRFWFYEYILPGCMMALLLGAIRGVWPGDEPEETASLLTSSIGEMISMRLPIFGGIANDAILYALDMKPQSYRPSGLRMTLGTPIEIGQNFVNASRAFIKGDNEEAGHKLTLATLDMLSFISRLPIAQNVKRFERGMEQYEEGYGTPLSVISPRPGKQSDKQKTILYGVFE
ncbi:MAG: hypothetical protein NC102_11560, partial [Clostridium sp.]|nr:hypothetical protein [Clostridium sp.]